MAKSKKPSGKASGRRPGAKPGRSGDAAAKSPRPHPGVSGPLTHEEKHRTAKIGIDTQLVNRIFVRVREIKAIHPEQTHEIDLNEWKIRERLENLRAAIDKLPDEDRELVTMLVIHGIHRACDEILIPPDIQRNARPTSEELGF